jgi:hypothetical protein
VRRAIIHAAESLCGFSVQKHGLAKGRFARTHMGYQGNVSQLFTVSLHIKFLSVRIFPTAYSWGVGEMKWANQSKLPDLGERWFPKPSKLH